MASEMLARPIAGEILATGISENEYLEKYAADFCEWTGGIVIKKASETLQHNNLRGYLLVLLNTYFSLRPIGQTVSAPFVMQLEVTDSIREPDIQVILQPSAKQLSDTAMRGPADICIEVVDPGSEETDHGIKFIEYERAGVREYWIIDPLRNECRFYRLNEAGLYLRFAENAEGYYVTPSLPDFKLHIATLWKQPLPDPISIVETLKRMLA
jgi:Uma2 family endonuclease